LNRDGKRGVIYFNEEFCKGCFICVEYCAKKVFVQSSRLNSKGYPLIDILKPEACNACMLCQLYCPDFALVVEKEE